MIRNGKVARPRAIHTGGIGIAANRGFNLVEVMVAVLILSVGLVGLAFLQTESLHYNTGAYARTQATVAAYDIMDRMRANSATVLAGNYTVATQTAATGAVSTYNSCKDSTCSCSSSKCTTAQLATYDLGEWYTLQSRILPQNSSYLSTITAVGGTSQQFTITIRWREAGGTCDGVTDLVCQTWTLTL